MSKVNSLSILFTSPRCMVKVNVVQICKENSRQRKSMSTKFVLIRATLIYVISDLRIVFKQMKYPNVGYFIFISTASLGWRRVSMKPKAIKFERKRKRFLKQICQVCGKANNRAFVLTKNLLPLVASS